MRLMDLTIRFFVYRVQSTRILTSLSWLYVHFY